MSTIVNVGEAKTHLSQLLSRVEQGEEIVIARAGKPVATLRAADPLRREFGFLNFSVPDDFDAPLPPEELAHWYGG